MSSRIYEKLGYISEIDGFRAVAVVSVVMFHLDKNWLPGGFLGVDLFFVISGYLITGILLKSEGGVKDTIKEFYKRRIRRIFPVLFFVVFVTLASSYFFLLPDAYQALGESAIASLLFFSNVYFYFNTGYFDVSSEAMPLLHTWSLSVEEQFYIFWPITLVLIAAYKKKWLIPFTAIAFSVSLAGSALVTVVDPQLAFFNFPFRVFQFLSGAIIPLAFSSLADARNSQLSGFLQLAGLTLVMASLLLFSETTPFPGSFAMVPTMGAALFLAGASFKERPAKNPLNMYFVNYLGKISFSVYLWHWPIIVISNIYTGHEPRELQEQFLILALTLLLSVFSYHTVEVPFRKPRTSSYWLICVVGIACIMFSSLLIHQNGFSSRVPGWDPSPKSSEVDGMRCEEYPGFGDENHCYLPHKGGDKLYLLWGDSHASHLAPFIKIIAEQQGHGLIVYHNCLPITDGETVFVRNPKNKMKSTTQCSKSRMTALKVLEKNKSITDVIFAGGWMYVGDVYSPLYPDEGKYALALRGLEKTITEAFSYGVNVHVMGQMPFGFNAHTCAYDQSALVRRSRAECGPNRLEDVIDKHGRRERSLKDLSEKNGVKYYSLIDPFCRNGICPIFVNNEAVYRDTNHLSMTLSYESKLKMIEYLDLKRIVEE